MARKKSNLEVAEEHLGKISKDGVVLLRYEEREDGSVLSMWASTEDDGSLLVCELTEGPMADSPDGSVQVNTMVRGEHVPQMMENLGLPRDTDVLRWVADNFNRADSWGLTGRIDQSCVEYEVEIA